MKQIHLDFGIRSYTVRIEPDFTALGTEMQKLEASKLLVLTDSNVSKLYLNEVYTVLQAACPGKVATAAFPAGEQSKTMQTVQHLYEACIRNGLDRKSVIVALGGGVVGDMAGFVAATYMRGIRYVQLPTTLLAQADSSVGGKVGLDFDGYKNIVGAFKQPALVYINCTTLTTLPARAFAAGMGEVIKYGVIRDKAFLNDLKENAPAVKALDAVAIEHVVEVCCRLKADIVQADETESGVRAILNFGHTVGHAIESAKGFTLLHGECVGIGMACALHIANKRGFVTDAELTNVCALLCAYGLKTRVCDLSAKTVLAYMEKDKKKEAGNIKFILPHPIGNAEVFTDVTKAEIMQALQKILVDWE